MDNNLTIRIITEEAKEIEASVISLFEILENQNKAISQFATQKNLPITL